MIRIVNRKIYPNLPFEEYLKLPGVSHSDIKNNFTSIVHTEPMKLGSSIHSYLLTPAEYDHTNKKIVKAAAMAIKNKVGNLWPLLTPELSVTCTMQVQDEFGDWFELDYRGRGDMVIMERLVIDAKVTKMPIKEGVRQFGYDDQQNGYRLAFGAKLAIIIGQHPEKEQTEVYVVPTSDEFWKKAILNRGRAVR